MTDQILMKECPLYFRHVITTPAYKSGTRPDMREVADTFAKYILENGLIVSHDAQWCPNMDAKQFRFSIYTMKPERGLP